MAKEFFCGEWLEKRMVLYAITHQLVTPISMLWICSVSISPSYPPLDIWGFLLTALFCTFSYEIGRKIRAPKDEEEGVDSYTKSIGLRMAPIVTAFLFLDRSRLVPSLPCQKHLMKLDLLLCGTTAIFKRVIVGLQHH